MANGCLMIRGARGDISMSRRRQCWVDSVKSVTSHDFLTQSSQVTSHAAPVDSVKSRCRAVTVTE